MPPLKNAKREAYCVNVAIKGMKNQEAFVAAGFKDNPNKDTMSTKVSKLNVQPEIQARLNELKEENAALARQDYHGDIISLHKDATDQARSLLKDPKDSRAKVAIIREVWSRSDPIIKQTTNISIKIDDKERARREKLLKQYEAEQKVIDITPAKIEEPKEPA